MDIFFFENHLLGTPSGFRYRSTFLKLNFILLPKKNTEVKSKKYEIKPVSYYRIYFYLKSLSKIHLFITKNQDINCYTLILFQNINSQISFKIKFI